MGESKLDFLPAGALKGIFSVSDTKKVHFSQGNLYAKFENSKWNWNFYSEQYGYNSLNSHLEDGFRDAADGDNEIDMFTWGYGNWSTDPTGTDYQGGTFTDWGCTIGDGNTWRTLTSIEWQYLFTFGYYTNDIRRNKYKSGVTVCGKANCVLLLPDDWKWEGTVGTDWQTEGYPETSTDGKVTWKTMEDAGAVCLPAAGERDGSLIFNFDYIGTYWSSSADGEDIANYVGFSSIGVVSGDSINRGVGFSVRLITDVK